MWAIGITMRPSSVVRRRRRRRRRRLLTFSKIFSSETSEQIFLKLGSNDLWHVGYKDSSFRIDRTKNMAAVAKNRPWGSNSSFSHITRKQKQLSKFREILGRSARQDLSAVQFSWRSLNRCRSYCPFYVVFSNFSTLTLNNSKTKAAIKILRHLRSFSTTRSICCANSVPIHETVLELLPF